MNYPYFLPALSYQYDSLEPYIDSRTMEIHYTKHHQAYIDNLNKAIEGYKHLYNVDLGELLIGLKDLPADIQTAVRNHGGGHYNHSFFWRVMSDKPSKPSGDILKEIIATFGSFEQFQEKFNAAAKSVFGSGWAWLVLDQNKKLQVIATPNQDCPIMQGMMPILGLDVWEHAYYLKYQNKRPDYIASWWHVVNWPAVEENYQLALKA